MAVIPSSLLVGFDSKGLTDVEVSMDGRFMVDDILFSEVVSRKVGDCIFKVDDISFSGVFIKSLLVIFLGFFAILIMDQGETDKDGLSDVVPVVSSMASGLAGSLCGDDVSDVSVVLDENPDGPDVFSLVA